MIVNQQHSRGVSTGSGHAGHGIAKMINVYNLADLSRPVGTFYASLMQWASVDTLTTGENAGNRREQIAAMEAAGQALRAPVDACNLHVSRLSNYPGQQAIIRTDEGAPIRLNDKRVTLTTNTGIDHRCNDTAGRQTVGQRSQEIGRATKVTAWRIRNEVDHT